MNKILADKEDLLKRCIIALDTQNECELNKLLENLKPHFKWVKVGLELFCSYGPVILEKIHSNGFRIFLDLKLYDIPQTVQNAITSLCNHPFDLLTIHLNGGNTMIEGAMSAIQSKNHPGKLLGVSVLTSFSEEQWSKTQCNACTIEDSIKTFIKQDSSSKIFGVVCSGHEIELIKKHTLLKSVVPGIRWTENKDDQVRIVTPKEAFAKGADFLVIGREITRSNDINKSVNNLKEHLHELPR